MASWQLRVKVYLIFAIPLTENPSRYKFGKLIFTRIFFNIASLVFQPLGSLQNSVASPSRMLIVSLLVKPTHYWVVISLQSSVCWILVRTRKQRLLLTTIKCILASSAFNLNPQFWVLIIPTRRFVNTVYFSCVNRIVIEMPVVEKGRKQCTLLRLQNG